jgi:hypothetical protein
MTSGYDPSEELSSLLDEATAPPRRTRAVSIEPPQRAEPAPQPPVAPSSPPSAPLPAPRTRRTTGRPGVEGQPPSRPGPAPVRSTSAIFPLPLLDRLHRLRLDRDVEGRPFNLTVSLAGAIDDLPEDAPALIGELDRYTPTLNIHKRKGDHDYLPEGRLAFRLADSQERKIARLVRTFYDATGQRIDKQDLLGLALLRLLADLDRGNA